MYHVITDIFSGLRGGIKNPDSQWNKGPLPTIAGGPAGSNGDPDGQINATSSLLQNITPYAYAQSARMGSDKNYQQIPHRIQKIIPELWVPSPDGVSNKLPISHSVDQGDISWAVNLDYNDRHYLLAKGKNVHNKHNAALNSMTPYCNFSTVNYLLAGLQNFWTNTFMTYQDEPDTLYATMMNNAPRAPKNDWADLTKALKIDIHPTICFERLKMFDTAHNQEGDDIVKEAYKNWLGQQCSMGWKNQILAATKLMFIPFGICAGSEDQGGQHEKSLAPVIAAVNFVITMTIDGQNRDLVNYWRAHNMANGDELTFRLDWNTNVKDYVMNHYYKGETSASFPNKVGHNNDILNIRIVEAYEDAAENSDEKTFLRPWQGKSYGCWQLQPFKSQFVLNDEDKFVKKYMEYDFRTDGVWRIGQMMHHRASSIGENSYHRALNYNDDTQFLTGALLQITFAPVWQQYQSYYRSNAAAPAINAAADNAGDPEDGDDGAGIGPNPVREPQNAPLEAKVGEKRAVDGKGLLGGKKSTQGAKQAPIVEKGLLDSLSENVSLSSKNPVPSSENPFPSSEKTPSSTSTKQNAVDTLTKKIKSAKTKQQTPIESISEN